MIDFYFAKTPNGQKVRIFFEETGLEHRAIRVDLGKGEQFKPGFLEVSPNNKIPAIVDRAPDAALEAAPLPVFESAAILYYLGEKTGAFLAPDPRARLETLQWLLWQAAGLGPMAGQAGHFRAHAPEPIPYAIDRFTREVARLYGVLDRRLDGRDFIMGAYSVADMATYPWVVPYEGHGQSLGDFPNLKRWFEAIAARPAVIRAYEGVSDPYAKGTKPMSEEERRILFGDGASKS